MISPQTNMATKRFATSAVACIAAVLLYRPGNAASAQTPATSQALNAPTNAGPAISDADRRYYENVKADPEYDWKQPIIFYGKVLDENGRPVPEAIVDFEWTDLSANGSSKKQCKSDAAGKFEIHKRGKRMCITVTKTGYYSSRDAETQCFEFANPADGLFTPDIAKPVVFHLRKAGDIEPLEAWKVDFNMKLNDQPVQFDPIRCKLVTNGALVLSLHTGPLDKEDQCDVHLRITVSGGGAQLAEGEFPFLAPEKGYDSSLDITVPKEASTEYFHRQYNCYFKFGQPPLYGRLEVNMPVPGKSTNASVYTTYWLNLSGSRNLEFDPAKSGNIRPVSAYYLRANVPTIDEVEGRHAPERHLNQ
jgi:hypothetical protein